MKYRKFGSLDWNVSEIGLGCWQIGADWGNVSEEKANEVLQSSFENGVNFFDTADVYGDGRSEKFVGNFINSISERIYVATKAGRRINPHVANGYYDKDLMESFVDRSLSNLKIEKSFLDKEIICGIDEVGRGCLAGPVIAAAVILDYKNIPKGINDSKKLSKKMREILSNEIMKNSTEVSIGQASVNEIDELNILNASILAMKRAYYNLQKKEELFKFNYYRLIW